MTSPDLPIEAPLEDALQQRQETLPTGAGDGAVDALPLEADEADAAEQARDDGPYDEER